ncbi:hypothetical protein QQF64_018247 [Cirrhinus molitorella]|uniref:Plasminogen receptor (KT) n=1 Tax=Cirrhinus molitorella TaxID=172907 RepID=A0ABR3LP78_9TELE
MSDTDLPYFQTQILYDKTKRAKDLCAFQKRLSPVSAYAELACPWLLINYRISFLRMGFLLSKSMEQNFQKQQEFMLLNARLQLERQLLMQNQMRERQMAMQVAWSREFLKYFGSFFGLATLGLTVGAVKKRKPALLAPVFPLSFILAYQMDAAYGSLIHRMREEAESIMASESERLALPQGMPTFESIEKSRRAKAHLSSLLEK